MFLDASMVQANELATSTVVTVYPGENDGGDL
jgi:hypothetical protein